MRLRWRCQRGSHCSECRAWVESGQVMLPEMVEHQICRLKKTRGFLQNVSNKGMRYVVIYDIRKPSVTRMDGIQSRVSGYNNLIHHNCGIL